MRRVRHLVRAIHHLNDIQVGLLVGSPAVGESCRMTIAVLIGVIREEAMRMAAEADLTPRMMLAIGWGNGD